MANENSTTNSGVSFTGLLAIAFIVLKLCNVIKWSWLWVLSPIWIPVLLAVTIGLIYLTYCIFFKWPNERKRLKAGMNEWAWKNRNKKATKSKWEQRVEEMQNKN